MMLKVLETERMVLRRMGMSDIDDLMGIFSDPVAMRHYPATKNRAEEWVRWTLGSFHHSSTQPRLPPRRRKNRPHAGEGGLEVEQEGVRLLNEQWRSVVRRKQTSASTFPKCARAPLCPCATPPAAF
jgi:hypothetical protein